jgi:hypothetical protein
VLTSRNVASVLGTMKIGGGTYASFARSLLWVAVLMAVAVGASVVVDSGFNDFVYDNPDRTQANATEMMLFVPLLFGFIAVIAVIGTFLVFTLPQCFQAILTDVLLRHFNRRGLFGLLLALPVTAGLAWYCYDYLTPTDFTLGINEGPDWTPYQHGLTLRRYLTMFAVQTPITLFSVLYCDATICNRPKKPIIICLLLFAVVLGAVHGLSMAEVQYQFRSNNQR